MRIRLLTLLTASLTLATVNPQTPDNSIGINLKQIEVEVSMNPSHYRELLDRFEAGDTLLRADQTATAYLGYAYTFEYDPTLDYDSIAPSGEGHIPAETLPALTEALKADPTSLQLTIASLIAASNDKSNPDIALMDNLQRRADMIVETILSTGEGILSESPFYVIRESDIKALLYYVIGVSDIVDKATIGEVDAYKIRFMGSPREHILYFNNIPQHEYEARKGINHNQSTY